MAVAKTVLGVKLKNPQIVYHPGQHIIGTVTIKLPCDNQAIDLIVRLLGKSTCKYPYKRKGKSPDVYFEKEHVIVEHAKVIGSPTAGKHDIDFQFSLPKNIPGSVDVEFGSISYQLMAGYGDNVVLRPVTVTLTESMESIPVRIPIDDCNEYITNAMVDEDTDTNKDTKEDNNGMEFSTLCCETEVVSNAMVDDDLDPKNVIKQENKGFDHFVLHML